METNRQSPRDERGRSNLSHSLGGMRRRVFLKRAVALASVPIGAALLAACGGATATATATAARSAAASVASAAPSAAATTAAATGAATTPADSASASAQAAAATSATPAATAAATAATSGTAQEATAKIVAAANAFLATLDNTQKASAQFDWTNTAQKQRWSNLPQGLYQRAGLMWGNLSDAQRTAWLAIMRATLSTEGYNRVIAEWTADDQLASGGGGGQLSYGMQYYWVALIGAPSATSAWQWQWGGHHVTVNATIKGANLSLTPSFIGVQPATYTANGQTIRPLGDIEDEAFALIGSLDATQQKAAILGSQAIDLVLGPGQDGKTIQAEGLPAAQMTATQQAAFLKLITHYAGLGTDAYAAARLAEVQANLAQTYLAWYGPTTKGSAAYFRVTGPTIVIEYSPQSMGGNAANHIHGIYRDPSNDYGAKFAQ